MSLGQRKSRCPAGSEVIPYAADGQGSGEMREDQLEDKRRFHAFPNKSVRDYDFIPVLSRGCDSLSNRCGTIVVCSAWRTYRWVPKQSNRGSTYSARPLLPS